MNGNGDIVVDSPAPKPVDASGSSHKNGIFVKNQWMCNCTPRLPGVLNKVRKMGKNEGRQFWACSKHSGPRAGCGFWLWIEEARDRERKALVVNGQMPIKTATPSRPLRQIKISESFQRSKVGEGSSSKKRSSLALSSSTKAAAKGKAPSVRFDDENLKPEHPAAAAATGFQVDAISIPSDSSEDESEREFDIDIDGDIELFESALEEPQVESPANGNLNPSLNPQLPDDDDNDDEPSEDGPRKVARTKNNTSPSKHLLVPATTMNAPQTSFTSTASTTVDTPSMILQDLNIRSTAAQERFAKKEVFDNADPVSFPDLRPYLNLNKNKKPITLPPTSATTGSSSTPTFKIPSMDSANPLGPHTGSLLNGTQSFNKPPLSPPPPPLREHNLPNGVSFPSTPNHKFAGIPGTPSSRLADDVIDVTDEVFEILQSGGAVLAPTHLAKLKAVLQKPVGKQKGYKIARDQLRKRSQEQNRERSPTPSPAFQNTQSFDPPSPSPIKNGSRTPSFQSQEVEKLKNENANLKQTVADLEKKVKLANKLAGLNDKSLKEYHEENEKLHKNVAKLNKEIAGLKTKLRGLEREQQQQQQQQEKEKGCNIDCEGVKALREEKAELEKKIKDLAAVEAESRALKMDIESIHQEMKMTLNS